MPKKQFMLDDDLQVSIYKRRSSRSLRLSVNPDGEIRVSIPSWTPYSAGLAFARSKYDWIMEQRRPRQALAEGQPVGKAHHLRFAAKEGISKPSSRVIPGAVLVQYPSGMAETDPSVQKAAYDGCVRALRAQAKQLLPQRLAKLAEAYGFTYRSINVKHLKRRWGSCDHNKNIVLNLFLMQLPWEHIDYVLLHELVHTRIMRHGPDFWEAMAEIRPDIKELRKQLREYQPLLDSPPATSVA